MISTFLGAVQDGDEEHKVELFEITLTPMKNREVFDAEEYESKLFGIHTPEFCDGNYGYDKFERADVEKNVRLEIEHAYAVVEDDALRRRRRSGAETATTTSLSSCRLTSRTTPARMRMRSRTATVSSMS